MARYNSCEEYVLQQLEEAESKVNAFQRNYEDLEEQFNVLTERYETLVDLVKGTMSLVKVVNDTTTPSKGTLYINGNYCTIIWNDDKEYEPLLKLKEMFTSPVERED